MSSWGNKDKISIAGTYNLSNAGMLGIAGASGFAASAVKPGDSVVVGTLEYIVKSVIGATGMTVETTGFGGATGLPTQSGATVYIQQKPKYVENLTERRKIFGVDTTEMGVAASKGAGHAGWVKNTVGSGRRSGRIIRETLVAMGVPAATMNDAEDIKYPDA